MERSSPGNITDDTKSNDWGMAIDLKHLPEINYDDPDVQKWMDQEQARWRKRHPNLTHETLIRTVEHKHRVRKRDGI